MNRFRALAAGAALALVVAAPARAEVVINDSIFIKVATFVPCANNGQGEVVHLSGPLHVLVSFNSNGKTAARPISSHRASPVSVRSAATITGAPA